MTRPITASVIAWLKFGDLNSESALILVHKFYLPRAADKIVAFTLIAVNIGHYFYKFRHHTGLFPNYI